MPCVTVSILEEFSVIEIKIKGYLLTRSQASFLLSKLTRKGRERKEYQSEIELPEHLKEIVDLVQEQLTRKGRDSIRDF
jgi:hypothetical protein